MPINLITIGTKMPDWVNQGYQEYAKRLPPEFKLKLIELPAEKRTKNADIPRILEKEGVKILNAIPPHNRVISLEIEGKAWSTEQFAQLLQTWQQQGQSLSLLVGGPEGLSPQCRQRADIKWSLSPLTLPHPLVRVVVAEQIYRAYTLLKGHPYHR